MKEKLKNIKSNIQEYKSTIQNIFEGSDEDLLQAINDFHNELK